MFLHICFMLWMISDPVRSAGQLTLTMDDHAHWDPQQQEWYVGLTWGPFAGRESGSPVLKFTGAKEKDAKVVEPIDFQGQFYRYRATQPGLYQSYLDNSLSNEDIERKPAYAELQLDSPTLKTLFIDGKLRKLEEESADDEKKHAELEKRSTELHKHCEDIVKKDADLEKRSTAYARQSYEHLENRIRSLTQLVTFQARLRYSIQTEPRRIVNFAPYNIEYSSGGGFNKENGKFTAPISGVYFFIASTGSYPIISYSTMQLCKESGVGMFYERNIELAQVYIQQYKSFKNMGTAQGVVYMTAGERVWLKSVSNARNAFNVKTTKFTGLLLFPDV